MRTHLETETLFAVDIEISDKINGERVLWLPWNTKHKHKLLQYVGAFGL